MRGNIAALIASLWVFKNCTPAQASPSQQCHGSETSITIDLDRSRLHLCEEGISRKQYRVALGQSGIAKRKRGDKKTPIGTYRLVLAATRPSTTGSFPSATRPPVSEPRATPDRQSASMVPSATFGGLGPWAPWSTGHWAASLSQPILRSRRSRPGPKKRECGRCTSSARIGSPEPSHPHSHSEAARQWESP